jgi:hypothetical protein
MQLVLSPIHLKKNEELITLLKYLGSVQSAYPAKLFVARRATFVAQVDEREKTRSAHQLHAKNEFLRRPNS